MNEPMILRRSSRKSNFGFQILKNRRLDATEGEAKGTSEESHLAPKVKLLELSKGFGAHGEDLFDRPASRPPSRCLKEVKGGRSALLHARITKIPSRHGPKFRASRLHLADTAGRVSA
jgi:hypothetical protein